MLSYMQKYVCKVHFSNTNKWISVCLGGIWSKSPISHKIVPRNRNSKSFEGKQFINVRWGLEIRGGATIWSKLIQLGVLLCFNCHFLQECFHTLKFVSDFYSRQGEWLFLIQLHTTAFCLNKKNDGRLFIFWQERSN